MSKLRDELRGAFAREQAELGDVRDARQRLMQSALANPQHESHRVQWAAGIAALLIAAIVIATFALTRASLRPHATPAVSPSAAATPGLTVSDSTPILLLYETSAYHRINVVTWDGRTAGVLPFDTGGYSSNPAANLFVSAYEVRDRNGKLLAQGNFGAKFFAGTWADDEEHFCLMSPFDNPGASGVATTLKLIDARSGVAAQDTVHVGTLYNQTNVTVAACSLEFDRAVVVQSGGQGVGTAQYWVVQLSTGKILWSHQFDLNALPVQVVASRDGQTIAESQAAGASGQWNATVYGALGQRLGNIAGAVVGFSWDGSLAVVDAGGGNGPAKIVRVNDGLPVWSGPSGPGLYVVRSMAQPDGGSLAIGIHNPANTDVKGLSATDLYIVAANGHVLAQMKDVYW